MTIPLRPLDGKALRNGLADRPRDLDRHLSEQEEWELFLAEQKAKGRNVTETETKTETETETDTETPSETYAYSAKREGGFSASASDPVSADEFYEGVMDVVDATPPLL